jgi:ferredoxin
MAISVDQAVQVHHARCISCMNCIEACPAKQTRPLAWGPPDRLGHGWSSAAVIGVLLLCAASAVAAAYIVPLPAFVKTRGIAPAEVSTVELRICNLTCRGRSNLLVGFLNRDDLYQIPGSASDAPGYYKLEAWPDPGVALVRISYDPRYADDAAIKRAIIEPYFDLTENRWWLSPFLIEGYDLLR